MTKEEAKHISEVLKAYSEGKTIQIHSGNYWLDCNKEISCILESPMKYRIKPESHYRPYANVEEFLNAQKEHGPYVTVGKDWFIIDRVQEHRVGWRSYNTIDGNWKTFDELMTYHWQDGTPCAIRED